MSYAEYKLYVDLVAMTAATLAGCAALLRYIEAHERTRSTDALFVNHIGGGREAARDFLSRVSYMIDARNRAA